MVGIEDLRVTIDDADVPLVTSIEHASLTDGALARRLM